METEDKVRHNIWLLFVALLSVLGMVSASGRVPASASSLPDISPITQLRQGMHNIAYLYANHNILAIRGSQ